MKPFTSFMMVLGSCPSTTIISRKFNKACEERMGEYERRRREMERI